MDMSSSVVTRSDVVSEPRQPDAGAEWDIEHLKESDTWDPGAYPLWHGPSRMSDKLRRSSPRELLVRGQGCWVEDVAGRRYLDARAGVCNVQLGYGRSDIAEAMYRQATEMPFGCAIRYDRPAVATLRYAAELVQAAPPQLTRVRLTHMGSASVENALQMSRLFYKYRGQPDKMWVLSLEDSFHGCTLMTLAASGEAFISEVVAGPEPAGFAKVPKPSMKECPGCTGDPSLHGSCTGGLEKVLEEIGPERIAALIVEPVMGNWAYPLSAHYLQQVRTLTDQHDFLLIFDEVVTGFGRLGTMFAADYFGVTPDIMCLAKGITSGYAPLGAVLVNERVYGGFDTPGGRHFANGSSTDGHPVSCAAASATLKALTQERVLDNVRRQEGRVLDRLRLALEAVPEIAEIRGVGLLIGIELGAPGGGPAPLQITRLIESECDRRGVLIQHAHNVIVLYPPLVISDEEADLMVDTVSEVIAKVCGEAWR